MDVNHRGATRGNNSGIINRTIYVMESVSRSRIAIAITVSAFRICNSGGYPNRYRLLLNRMSLFEFRPNKITKSWLNQMTEFERQLPETFLHLRISQIDRKRRSIFYTCFNFDETSKNVIKIKLKFRLGRNRTRTVDRYYRIDIDYVIAVIVAHK